MGQSFVLDPSGSIKQGQFNPFSAGKLKDATIELLKEIFFFMEIEMRLGRKVHEFVKCQQK